MPEHVIKEMHERGRWYAILVTRFHS